MSFSDSEDFIKIETEKDTPKIIKRKIKRIKPIQLQKRDIESQIPIEENKDFFDFVIEVFLSCWLKFLENIKD